MTVAVNDSSAVGKGRDRVVTSWYQSMRDPFKDGMIHAKIWNVNGMNVMLVSREGVET